MIHMNVAHIGRWVYQNWPVFLYKYHLYMIRRNIEMDNVYLNKAFRHRFNAILSVDRHNVFKSLLNAIHFITHYLIHSAIWSIHKRYCNYSFASLRNICICKEQSKKLRKLHQTLMALIRYWIGSGRSVSLCCRWKRANVTCRKLLEHKIEVSTLLQCRHENSFK